MGCSSSSFSLYIRDEGSNDLSSRPVKDWMKPVISDTIQKIAAMKTFFSGLTAKEYDQLLSCFTFKPVKAEAIVAGDEIAFCFVDQGNLVETNEMEALSDFGMPYAGEMNFIQNKNFESSFVATENAMLFTLTRADYDRFLDNNIFFHFKQTPFLAKHVEVADYEDFYRYCALLTFSSGDVIVKKGLDRKGGFFYVVTEGYVMDDANGRIISAGRADNYFGEDGLLDNAVGDDLWASNIIARTNVKIIAIGSDGFHSKMFEFAIIKLKMMKASTGGTGTGATTASSGGSRNGNMYSQRQSFSTNSSLATSSAAGPTASINRVKPVTADTPGPRIKSSPLALARSRSRRQNQLSTTFANPPQAASEAGDSIISLQHIPSSSPSSLASSLSSSPSTSLSMPFSTSFSTEEEESKEIPAESLRQNELILPEATSSPSVKVPSYSSVKSDPSLSAAGVGTSSDLVTTKYVADDDDNTGKLPFDLMKGSLMLPRGLVGAASQSS